MFDIVFILDESSSMALHANSYIKGINYFISTQKIQNPTARFTMIKFSDTVNTLCVDSIVSTLPKFTHEHYKPLGMTSLYDAIGRGINLKYTNELTNVIMIILTDGEENSSTCFKFTEIEEKIKYLSCNGWSFVYIASNQNATEIGKKMGIQNCVSYNESDFSISQIADVCNISIGHAIYKWSGVQNEYTNQLIPDDISVLMEKMEKIGI